jgi:hemerythrin
MKMPQHIDRTSHRAEIMAVEVLDELVSHLIESNRFGVNTGFLDWVNHNATHFVVDRVRRSKPEDYFPASADPEKMRHAMRKKVYEWVMPHISQRFGNLAMQASDFSETRSEPARRVSDHGSGLYAIDLVL